MPDNNMSGIEDLFNLVISKSLMISLFRKMKDLKDLMHFTHVYIFEFLFFGGFQCVDIYFLSFTAIGRPWYHPCISLA